MSIDDRVFNGITLGPLIHGESWSTTTAPDFEVVNPATGETLAWVHAAGTIEVDTAVKSTQEALKDEPWARIGPAERGRVLFRMAGLLRERLDYFADLEARDVGKLLDDARAEIELSAMVLEYYAGAADKVLGDTFTAGPDKWAYTVLEPIGVVAAIVPWNYPLPLATLKVAPALAMGNGVVLKPAEEAPLTCIEFGLLALEAGLPPGILNVIPGLGEIAGAALSKHPAVGLVTFTGSTEVGKSIMRSAADRVANVKLELGGKSPQLVFPDADLDAAAENIAVGLFKNAGQDCCAGSRIIVHEAIHDDLVERVRVIAESQRLGDPLVNGITMGPVISELQRDRVHGYSTGALKDGASLVTGGESVRDGMPERSSFYLPTLFTDVTQDMTIFQEEVFGPVGVVTQFDDEQEALELANASRYGLAAAVWTSDLDTAHLAAREIAAGMVWINEYYAHVLEMPFGGYKQSGIGKDYSMHALDSYYQIKEVAIRHRRQEKTDGI